MRQWSVLSLPNVYTYCSLKLSLHSKNQQHFSSRKFGLPTKAQIWNQVFFPYATQKTKHVMYVKVQMQASRGWRPTTRQDQHYWSDKNPVLSPSRDFKFYLIHIDVSRQHASLSSSSSSLWSTPPWVLFLKCKCVWWRTVSGFCNNQRKYNRSSRQHTFLFSVHDQCRALTEVQQSACSGSTRLLLDDLHCLSQGLFYCLCHSHLILILIS